MERERPLTKCPGCGLELPAEDGPTHPYMESSAACWRIYGEILAREYQSQDHWRLHQTTVDTYAVQHPGKPNRRSIQSVALHLITLCLVLENDADPLAGPRLHQRLAGRAAFEWLEPPHPNGSITVADVVRAADATEHLRLVELWARDVWTAWQPHHPTVRGWIENEFE